MDNKVPKTELTTTEFVTAISHYYRGEMTRANVWRTRLDVTTNWAIITAAAFLSFGFGSENISHLVIILATIFVLFFLIIEARRYKYFDLWRWRIALLGENFFAPIISPDHEPLQENWRELLSEELQRSQFKMTFIEAFGRRLRRNYIWFFLVLGLCWITKVAIHPTPMEYFSISEFVNRARIFHIVPGWLVLSVGLFFNVLLVLVAIYTSKAREVAVRIYPAGKSKDRARNI